MISITELNELLLTHTCLRSLNIRFNREELTYDLFLSMSISENIGSDTVLIRFTDVSNFSSRDIGGGLTQMMHMNVIELNFGWERINYELSELEDKKLSFYFSSFLID